MRHLLQYTLKWMFGELVCNGPFNTANHSWYDCWTLIRSDSPFSVVSIHEGKKNIVNHVRQSGYFMTSWHGIYGMDPAIRAHQKVNVDSLFSLFVLINTFVCWPYYGCCYDVFLWDKEVIYQKQQAPFTLQYLTTGWTLQLVEHTHPFFFRKIRAAPSGLGNPWSMPNSSSSINHQLQQRFGGNPTATPAASDQVVDSHKGEFHHGADWRIDLAPEGREWGPCHPPLFFNAGNNGEDHFPNKWLNTARKWRSSRGKSCSNPSFPKFPDICGSNSRGAHMFQPPLEKMQPPRLALVAARGSPTSSGQSDPAIALHALRIAMRFCSSFLCLSTRLILWKKLHNMIRLFLI